MLYLQLFLSFFKIGCFGFGGGLAILSLIQGEVIQHGWIAEADFIDIVAISQMTPGPISINCATYTGYVVTHSVLGAVVASIALILPGILSMIAVGSIFNILNSKYKGDNVFQNSLYVLRLVVIGLILATVFLLLNEHTFYDSTGIAIFTIISIFYTVDTFFISNRIRQYKWVAFIKNPIAIIIISAIVGCLVYL